MNKKFLAVALSAVILCSAQALSSSASAAEVPQSSSAVSVQANPSEGLKYTVKENEATITGYTGTDTAVVIPSEIDGYKIVAIGNYAFSEKTAIVKVVLPDTITSIGASAFKGCTGLTSVKIPNKVQTIGSSAFEGCTNLSDVNIPTLAAAIKNHAFKNTAITKVTIPNTVTEIGEFAFESTKLETVTVPNSVTTFGRNVFHNSTELKSVVIGQNVLDKGFKGLFEKCTALTEVTLNNSVTTIPDYAFNGYGQLTKITLPNSLESIGTSAFNGCTGLTVVKISNKVQTINSNAFNGCKNLEKVFIPNSVTKIVNDSFKNCSKLTIYCYTGSYAAKFSEDNNIPVVLLDASPLKNNSTVNNTTIVKGTTIKITGKATGGSGKYEYRFSYKRSGAKNYTVKSDYGKATYTYLTPGYADTYTIKIDVRDEFGFEVTKYLTVNSTKPLENNSTVSTTVIPKGEKITITGIADGGKGPYQYKFSYKRSGAKNYTVKSDYGKATSTTLQPGYVDTYTIVVDVKDSTGTIETKTFTVKSIEPLVNNSTVSATSVEKGTTIKITGDAKYGQGPYKYKISYKRSGAKNFTVKSDYGKATATTLTPGYVDTYTIKVEVMDSLGYVKEKTFTVKVNAVLSNRTSISTSTDDNGTTITVTGNAAGGTGSYSYAYYYKKSNSTKWILKGTEFGQDASVTIKPGTPIDYNIKVIVKDSSGKEAVRTFTISVAD